MASGMQIDVAELAGIVAEGPLFGVFLVLDIAAIYILVGRRRYSQFNIPMTLAAIVMMALALTQFIVDSTNVFMGFISLERAARLKFFADLTEPIFAAKHAIYFTMLFVGDTIVVSRTHRYRKPNENQAIGDSDVASLKIYRCYVVWNKTIWIVLVPILCSLGSAACAYQTIWAIRHFSFHTSFIRLEHNMGFAIFSLSFAANVMATGLLSFKIWKADRELKKTISVTSLQMSRLPIIRIIVESGAINTAYLLIYTVILQSGTNGIQVVACIVTPLVGIIFAAVIIRAALAAETHARTRTADSDSHGLPGPQLMAFRRNVSTSQNFTIGGSGGVMELAQKNPDTSYKTESI